MTRALLRHSAAVCAATAVLTVLSADPALAAWNAAVTNPMVYTAARSMPAGGAPGGTATGPITTPGMCAP